MSALTIKSEMKGKFNVIQLLGELTNEEADALDVVMNKQIEKKLVHWIFDCEGLEYMNTKSAALFLKYDDASQGHGGKLVLAQVPPRVLEVFKVLGLDKVLSITASVDEALDRYQES